MAEPENWCKEWNERRKKEGWKERNCFGSDYYTQMTDDYMDKMCGTGRTGWST